MDARFGRTKDEAAVDRALERFARSAKTIRRLSKRVLRAQEALRQLVSKRAWLAYLAVEERVGAQQLEVLDAAIRIALSRRRRRRSVRARTAASKET